MEDFIANVAKMRDLQKQYFKHRDPHTLQACKKIEREIDAFLAIGKTPEKKSTADANQANLF
jgi:hypothetical protein